MLFAQKGPKCSLKEKRKMVKGKRQPRGLVVVVHLVGHFVRQWSTRMKERNQENLKDTQSKEAMLRCYQDVIDHLHSLKADLDKDMRLYTISITCHFLKQKLLLLMLEKPKRSCIMLANQKWMKVARKQIRAIEQLEKVEEILVSLGNVESDLQTLMRSYETSFKIPQLHLDGSDPLSLAGCLTAVGMDLLSRDIDWKTDGRYLATSLLWVALLIHQSFGTFFPVLDVAGAHVRMGQAFWSVGMLDKGHASCQRALTLLVEESCWDLGDSRSIGKEVNTKETYLETLAQCYRFLGHTSSENATSLAYYQRELEIHEKKHSDNETKAAVHVEIAACLFAMEEMERSIQHSEKALRLTNCRIRTVDIYINVAMVHADLRRKGIARNYLLQAREMVEEVMTSSLSNEESRKQAGRQLIFICGNLGRLDHENEYFILP